MSLTKVTYSMIDGAPINVRDFGAVGDGVADDTQALQDAVDYAHANGGVLYLPAGTFKITSTIDLLAGSGTGVQDLKYSIMAAGPRATIIDYQGSGVAIEAHGAARYGVITGGFTIQGNGTGTIGLHLRGINWWNTTGSTIEVYGFTDKQISIGPRISPLTGGGLWNTFGTFIVRGDATAASDYGFFIHQTANANTFEKIQSFQIYSEDAITLQGTRNVVTGLSLEGGALGTPFFKAGCRVNGQWLILGAEFENSASITDPNFESALVIEGTSQVLMLHVGFTGFGSGNNPVVASGATYMTMPQSNVFSPLSNSYASISTNAGLVLGNTLISSNHSFDEFIESTVGVSGTYSGYLVVLGLNTSTGVRGTKIIRSIKVTNDTDQTIDVQVRNFDPFNSAGANNAVRTIAAGASYEFTPHEVSFLLNDANNQYTLRARYRTSAASYTGTVKWEYGYNKI